MDSNPDTSPEVSARDSLRAQALSILDLQLPRPARPPAYRWGMVLVAITMVLLPLIYVGVVALGVYGLYWHATENLHLFQTIDNKRGAVIAYAGPLFVGVVVVFFLFKPLLAPRSQRTESLEVSERDEPFLFDFVDALFRAVGAQSPARILVDTQVNASAGFHQGGFGLMTSRRDLTIGLPLVRALSLRQFAGVLAHEFGHFGQGAAMRMSFLVMGVNAWFARVVYQRDAWDDRLARMTDSGVLFLVIVSAVARACVWLTRRVLWGLMYVARAVSSYMSRQMEYDADTYEIRLAGSVSFCETMMELNYSGAAANAGFNRVSALWEERKLPEDLPGFLGAVREELPDEVAAAIRKGVESEEESHFATHPRSVDRMSAANAAADPGVFALDAPSTILFDGFSDLSQQASTSHYRAVLGRVFKSEHLVANSTLLAAGKAESDARECMERYLARPAMLQIRPPALPEPEGAAGAEELRTLRAKAEAAADQGESACDAVHEALQRSTNAQIGIELGRAKIKFDPAQLDLPTRQGAELAKLEIEAQDALAAAADRLDRDELPSMKRLAGALGSQGVADLEPDCRQQIEELTRIYRALRAASVVAAPLGGALRTLECLFRVAPDDGEISQPLARAIERTARSVSHHARAAQAELGELTLPFGEPGARPVAMASNLFGNLDRSSHPGEVFQAVQRGFDRMGELTFRVLAELCVLAESAERELGLPDAAPEA